MKINKLVVVGFISLSVMVNLSACMNMGAIHNVKESINDTPSTQVIENKNRNISINKNNSDNITFSKNEVTNNNYDYSKEYNYYTDNDDEEENEKLREIETQMNLLKSQNDANEDYLRAYKEQLEELEKEQKENSNKTTIISVNRGEEQQSHKTPWVGPKTNLCPYSAGWPAICGECGKQGGIHQDIIEWMDDNNDCHLTHKECFSKYCVNNNVWPNHHYQSKI